MADPISGESLWRRLTRKIITGGRKALEWLGVIRTETLDDIRREVREGWENGETTNQIVQRIVRPSAAEPDNPLAPRRSVAERYEQKIAAAVNSIGQAIPVTAQELLIQTNAGAVGRVQWVAILDSKTCPRCGSLHGKVWRITSEDIRMSRVFGTHPVPPLHLNCLPGNTLVSPCGQVTGVSKRWFDGDLVVINTSMGHHIACTPNHPILTDFGWIAAQSIKEGCRVICDGMNRISRSAVVNGKDHDMPALIEDIVESFLNRSQVVSMPVPTSGVDFHGDGIDGEVAVIGSNRFLRDNTNSSVLHEPDKKFVYIGLGAKRFFFSFRRFCLRFKRGFSSTNGIMSRLREFFSFFWRRSLHSCELLFTAISKEKPFTFQNAGDRGSTDIESLCDTCYADTGFIERNNFVSSKFGNPSLWPDPTGNNAALPDNFTNNTDTNPVDVSNGLLGGTIKVKTDNVISIKRKRFSGHVYNLETEKGYYIGNGIITHNCRCSLLFARPGQSLPQQEDFDEWLRRQPKETVEDILGKAKAELFETGKLEVKDFVDGTRRSYTLSELARRNRNEFDDTWLQRQSPERVQAILGKTKTELFNEGFFDMRTLLNSTLTELRRRDPQAFERIGR